MESKDKITTLDDTMPEAGAGLNQGNESTAKAIAGANHDEQLSGRKIRVTFYSQDAEGGKDPIFASLNFYAYQIPRDVAVDIPSELLAVFEDANTRVISTTSAGGVNERNIKRFNYTVHGEVQQAARKAKKAA